VVFDREGYSPASLAKMKNGRIACLTYHKYPGEDWPKEEFFLRNPAYNGTACFNKTKRSKRQRITRFARLRGGIAPHDSAGHERRREDWIEIPVPAIITEESFAPAAERLQRAWSISRPPIKRSCCR
jgi:hypothetical protein